NAKITSTRTFFFLHSFAYRRKNIEHDRARNQARTAQPGERWNAGYSGDRVTSERELPARRGARPSQARAQDTEGIRLSTTSGVCASMSSQAIPSSNHDEWHRVHAQLLKSVADAQAKLLAAQNEITDKLDKLSEYSTYNLEVAEKR